MDYSGPGTLADVEQDLVLSDDDVENNLIEDHWPRLASSKFQTLLPVGTTPSLMEHTPISNKRCMEHDTDSSNDPSSPAAKTTKCDEYVNRSQPQPAIKKLPTLATKLALPAFAPRAEYVKLLFRENPGVNVKLRWLSEVVKMFSLDRDLAEVKMSAVTS